VDNRRDPVDSWSSSTARDVSPRATVPDDARDASLDTGHTLGRTAAPHRGRGGRLVGPLPAPDSHLSERLLLKAYGLDPDDLEGERIRR
jgi:hypothetical protein